MTVGPPDRPRPNTLGLASGAPQPRRGAPTNRGSKGTSRDAVARREGRVIPTPKSPGRPIGRGCPRTYAYGRQRTRGSGGLSVPAPNKYNLNPRSPRPGATRMGLALLVCI